MSNAARYGVSLPPQARPGCLPVRQIIVKTMGEILENSSQPEAPGLYARGGSDHAADMLSWAATMRLTMMGTFGPILHCTGSDILPDEQ